MANTPQRYLVSICQHRSCIRNGSKQVLAEFRRHQSDALLVSECECQGQCGSGPTVKVMPENIWYCRVQPQDVQTIVEQHLTAAGEPVESLLNPRIHQTQSAYANLAAQYQSFIEGTQES